MLKPAPKLALAIYTISTHFHSRYLSCCIAVLSDDACICSEAQLFQEAFDNLGVKLSVVFMMDFCPLSHIFHCKQQER